MKLKWWKTKVESKNSYLSNNKGTAAIEFAIVSPAFFLLFIGILEIGSIMLIKTTLEKAIFQVSRFGRTGGSVAGQTSQQVAVGLATQYTFGLVDPSKLVLTITPYANFSSMPSLGQAPTTGVQNFGAGNQPVLYTLSYDWNFFTPLVGKYLSQNGTSMKLTASAVIQNEPF